MDKVAVTVTGIAAVASNGWLMRPRGSRWLWKPLPLRTLPCRVVKCSLSLLTCSRHE